MIIVFSISNDATTQLVLEWLRQQGQAFVFVNETNPITQYQLYIGPQGTQVQFVVNDRSINSQDITAVWYRRNPLQFAATIPEGLPTVFKHQLAGFIQYEATDFRQILYRILEPKCPVNRGGDAQINKLWVLQEAARLGIRIPDTQVFTDTIPSGLHHHIVKPIHNGLAFFYQDEMCRLLTQPFVQETANGFPTLVQVQVPKQFEVRSFYLRGKLYSIAMFTQQNDATVIDYRNYDYAKPARCVPFKLPRSLTVKLRQLMKALQLQSGSIDLICGTDNELYFLEVNPIGQFGNVSHHGNYYIEKAIAKILTDEKTKNSSKHPAA